MIMSLARLAEQFRTRRFEQRAVDRATITVRRAKPFADQRRFTGRVLVDCNTFGYLVGGESSSFNVEPGEHTVTVMFGRRPVVFCRPGQARCSASVSLSAGERADLVCGVRPEIIHLWKRARRAWEIQVMFACAFAWGLTWIATPHLREAVALVVQYLPVHGLLIPLSYRVVSPLFVQFCLTIFSCWMLRRWPQTNDTSDATLLARIGSPYYIERSPAVGIDGK
jgi:hypothetical protein